MSLCGVFQDYVDAFEKLLRLGLKNQQEHEIIHLLVDLCTRENTYNPFYSFLCQKFCEYNRRFQVGSCAIILCLAHALGGIGGWDVWL